MKACRCICGCSQPAIAGHALCQSCNGESLVVFKGETPAHRARYRRGRSSPTADDVTSALQAVRS